MALADIIQKIQADGVREAEQIIASAKTQAKQIVASAQSEVVAERARALAQSEETALREANIVLVNGRLKARDTELEHKRALIGKVLDEVVSEIEQMDASSFARLIAGKTLVNAHGTETLRLAGLTAEHCAAIKAALAEHRSTVTVVVENENDEVFSPSIMLHGDGMKVDLSPRALVTQARRELEPMLVETMFSEASGTGN